ncbi:hypothetical protein Tco_1078615 [Tanacetum coccineum]|uniref:Transposase (Putative), gypsy type n=1 Tax=Tanacetum coccineum TaxID=301880 RepID=A0ABQ5HPK2_9ASTR
MSFSKRPENDVVCYTKPLDSLKNWNDHFFWVDAFACPASFPWNTSKSVSKDPFPKSSEFNAEHYAILVAHPAPFHKYPKPFLYLVGISRYYTLDENTYPQFLRDDDEEMDLLSFIRTADLTKVRIGERQRGKDEQKLLDTTVGRTVPLLPVVPARAESELDASIDRLFDEGGGGTQAEQGDSAGGGSDEQDIIIQPVITVVTTAVEDVIPLQPRRLKKRKIIVSDAGGSSHPPKKLMEDHETLSRASVGGKSKSVVQQLLTRTVQNVVVRGEPILTLPFATSSVSATPEHEEEDHTDSLAGANLRTIGASQRADHTVGSFAGLTDSDFIVGGAARQMSLSAEVRMHAEFNIRERRRLSAVVEEKNLLLKTRDKEVANLKAQLLVKEAEATEAVRLRAEVQTLADRNIVLEREKGELDIKVADLAATVKVREQEVANLDVVVTSIKFHNDNLTDQVHKLEASSAVLQDKVTAYDNFIGQLEKFQDNRIREMNEKLNKVDADLLAISKCLNSIEYLSSFGAAIGKDIQNSMQEGLSAGIIHGAAGRVLTDVAAYNPSAEADYLSALQRLQNSLAERLDLAELQPPVDQLMVPIHHSLDQTVVGATSLSFSLDVSQNRVRRIKENIANDRSALYDVFVPLAEPLSIDALEGTAGTSGTTPGTTTALFVTFASTSTISPISTDDYEIVHTDD